MAAILNSAIVNLAMLDSAILVFPLKVTHTCQDWFPPFPQKNFTHSFWLDLMMAAILTSTMLVSDTAILDSDTLLSFLRFTQNTLIPLWLWLKLIQSDSKLIHSHLTWWWQPSWILPSWFWPSWIQPSYYFLSNSTHTCQYWFPPFPQKTPHSFILTQLDDGSHLEFCHVGFGHCHLGFRHLLSSLRFTQKHSHSTLTLTQTNSIWLKFIQSHLTWWRQPSWILTCWIWPCWIQPF